MMSKTRTLGGDFFGGLPDRKTTLPDRTHRRQTYEKKIPKIKLACLLLVGPVNNSWKHHHSKPM